MDKRVTPKRVTSPSWGPPPQCKQALSATKSTEAVPSEIFFVFFFHPNHLLFAGVNNRNVNITQ